MVFGVCRGSLGLTKKHTVVGAFCRSVFRTYHDRVLGDEDPWSKLNTKGFMLLAEDPWPNNAP